MKLSAAFGEQLRIDSGKSMKLRIKGNSLRLRLTRDEVGRAGAGQTIVESTPLTGATGFGYALTPSDSATMAAALGERGLEVSVPRAALSTWANSENVAVVCPAAAPGPDILVEKDFACLSPRDGDDDANTFPHPEAGSKTC